MQPLTADQIEAALVVRHRLDLARQQIDARRRFRLVRMVNVEKAVGRHAAASLLPHAAHFAFALLQQMAGAGDAVVFVALQLVQRVAGAALVGGDVLAPGRKEK